MQKVVRCSSDATGPEQLARAPEVPMRAGGPEALWAARVLDTRDKLIRARKHLHTVFDAFYEVLILNIMETLGMCDYF